LHVLVQGSVAAGLVARRADYLAVPPEVWEVDDRALTPACPAPSEGPTAIDPEDLRYVELLRAHGAEPVVEHGRLTGEMLGLEVARVVDGRLEVGVGRHDRTARSLLGRREDVGLDLDQAVAAVRRWRRPGVPRHPANTLCRSRWLRSILCADPDLVDAAMLAAVAPPLPAADLTDNGAVPCVGVDAAGEDLVVVCSTGVDLDLVPTAADCRGLHRPGAPLVIVVPEADDHPVTRALAGQLVSPVEVRTVPRAWEELGRS
jgi:hypothetical protein